MLDVKAMKVIILTAIIGMVSCASNSDVPRPFSDVRVGHSSEQLFNILQEERIYAASCNRTAWFHGDDQFDQCVMNPYAIIIFRDDSHQYAHTLVDGNVSDVTVTDYRVT